MNIRKREGGVVISQELAPLSTYWKGCQDFI